MPVFTAIAGIVAAAASWIGALGTLGTFLLQTSVGIGLNLLAQALAGKPPAQTFSINTTLRSGGDVPRSFLVGDAMTAGSLVWVNTWGTNGETPNAYVTQVIACADLPVAGLNRVWVNGELCTLGATAHADGRGYPVTQYNRDGQDNLWVKFYDGNQTTYDGFLHTKASSGGRTWSQKRIGYGVAYAITTALVTKNLFSGIPSFKFEIAGMKMYDITKDDTAGGIGTHRWGDPSTWGGDGDRLPAVQAYTILRGLRYGGAWFYGLQGLVGNRLPADNWIEQIGKCRTPILSADGTEPAYRSAGEITINAPVGTSLDVLMTTCQGRISEVGGFYRTFLGAPDLPSFHITDDDILSTEERAFTPFYGLADIINGVAATYPSPADGWEVKSAPSLYRTDLEVKHGNRRLMADIELTFVPYAEQVQRLMNSALLEGQRARRHTHVLPPKFWAFAIPGVTFTWTSARNGYTAKLFRIDGSVDRPNLDVMLDQTEVNPADFSWSTGTDFVPPVDGALGPIRPAPQPIIDFFAGPDSVVGDNNRIRPAIRVEWDGNMADIIGVEFQVRLAETAEIVLNSNTDDFAIGSIKLSNNIFSATLYGVRARYKPGSDRETLWSDWRAVTTPDIRNNDVSVYLDGVGEDIYEQLLAVAQDMDEVRARLEQLAIAASEAAGTIAQENSIAVRYRNNTASVLQTISATVDDLGSAAEILEALQATVGNVEAGILWRMTAEAGIGDVTARVVLQVRATVGDAWVSAGTIWEAGFVGGNPLAPFARVVVNATQFVVTDGTDAANPLVFEDGELKLTVARIGNAIVEQLTTANGKLTINGSGTDSDISIVV